MRRGSIQTFESLARRNSSNMAQFPNNRSEFMTSDLGLNDIEYERKGGFFMTHKKTALVVSAVVVVIVAAGFVGAYIGSTPKEKAHDAMALIDGDVGCDPRVVSSKYSLSDAIRPSRYRVVLTPILEDDPISRLRGRVSIEFRYNGSARLEEIVLNARKIQVTRTRLIYLDGDLPKARRRRSPQEDVGGPDGNSSVTTSGSFVNDSSQSTESTLPSTVPVESISTTVLPLDNDTIFIVNGTTQLPRNLTNQENRTELYPTSPTNYTEVTSVRGIKALEPDDSAANNFPNPTEALSSVPEVETPFFGTKDKNESTEIAISRTETDDKGGFIVFYPASSLKLGNYLFEIDYDVPMHGYNVSEASHIKTIGEKELPAGRLNPTNIRNFFPLFDDVRMKARFSLAMPRLKSMVIRSNMPIKNTTAISDEWVLVTFEETPPIAPNNLVVAETRHVEILADQEINETRVVVMGDKLRQGTAEYLIHMVGPVVRSLLDLFTVDLPVKKLTVIGVNDIDHSGGNPGLITIQESLYRVSDESPKVTKERALMSLIRLIGQQWLGGLVNMKNSTDAWVLESSLLYLQHHLLKEINPDFNRSTFLMDVQPDPMEVDGYSLSRSLQSKLNPTHSNSFYIHEIYAMGACLIRMLHGALKRSGFRAGYRSFVLRWSGENADVASFWEAMASHSTDDKQPEGEINLSEVMKIWTQQSGYPVVTVTRNYESGSAVVHQARFSYDKPKTASTQLWHIPLTWISNNGTERICKPSFKWMKPEVETRLENVGEPGDNQSWVVFNPTKSGYFRVNYDHENWKLLASALSENHEAFAPETRATLVDDVFSLAFIGLVPYSIAFKVIGYLPESEMEPEPWTMLLHHTVKLNLALYDSPAYLSYQEYMIKFLSDIYAKVGSKIAEGTRLTRIAHQLACMFDYPDYVTWAKKSYAGFENLTGLPINDEVPSDLHNDLLCAFAKFEHELGWQWWQQKFTNVTNREKRISLLSSLACFQVPWMLQAVLNDIVYSRSFEESDALVILESFSNYPAASQTALQFVESNWKNITRRYPKSCKITSAFLDASSTGFTSKKDVEDFQSFREKNYESLKKVGYVTARLEAKANAFVSFLQTSLTEFHKTIANSTSFQSNVENNEEIMLS